MSMRTTSGLRAGRIWSASSADGHMATHLQFGESLIRIERLSRTDFLSSTIATRIMASLGGWLRVIPVRELTSGDIGLSREVRLMVRLVQGCLEIVGDGM